MERMDATGYTGVSLYRSQQGKVSFTINIILSPHYVKRSAEPRSLWLEKGISCQFLYTFINGGLCVICSKGMNFENCLSGIYV